MSGSFGELTLSGVEIAAFRSFEKDVCHAVTPVFHVLLNAVLLARQGGIHVEVRGEVGIFSVRAVGVATR